MSVVLSALSTALIKLTIPINIRSSHFEVLRKAVEMGAERMELGIIGAGPAASSLLERLSANAAEMLGGRHLRVHLIDPHRAGTGRVWRPDNHAGLWMNSLAEDVTMFPDDTVIFDGPIRPGPSLFEWSRSVGDAELAELADPTLIAEIRGLTGTTFPTRRVQSVYLEWFHRQIVAALPPEVELVVHAATAIDLADDGRGRQRILLEGAVGGDLETLDVDVVVLALGHLDAHPDAVSLAFGEFAAAHGLVHIGAGHTAELQLDALAPGTDVIALGFGQAFTDLLVLVTEARGGRFVTDGGGEVRYEPSGREPIIHVGSRRGVPYRSKMDYRLQAPPAPAPRFFDEAAITDLLGREEPLEFRRDVLPIVLREVGWAYYHELFNAHPERTTTSWAQFSAAYAEAATPAETDALIAASVRDRRDVFDIDRINTPLAGLHFATAAALHEHVSNHVRADVERRTDPAFSADLGAFNALLQCFVSIARIAASGRMSTRSRIEDVAGWWFSFFMYYASGPPPARLRQLLALERVGIVRFIGAGTTVRADSERGAFVATSTSHPEQISAGAMIDAVVAPATVSRTADVLLQRLRDRGELLEEIAADESGWSANTGKVVVSGPALNLVDRDGEAHPHRHGIGSFTSRPAAGAFSRPRTNAPTFRQNDVVARAVLASLVRLSAAAQPDLSRR
ncbi:MAG: hypothetical protein JWN62_4349 [Acidimicrobiales bacterium]|nr:hypothetical protein [Acidimicrobiales bacterium]